MNRINQSKFYIPTKCMQHGSLNKCICTNCNKITGINNNLNHLNKSVSEVDFTTLPRNDIRPIIDRLDKLEKHYQTNYKNSFYEPPSYYQNGQEFNYPYKFRNQDNIWFHNEGGDFGGHSLYENPYTGPRNTLINNYAYGSHIPYFDKQSKTNP